MPSSSVRRFTDPDEYAAALQQGPVEITVRQRGTFIAKLWTVNLATFGSNVSRKSWHGRRMSMLRAGASSSRTAQNRAQPWCEMALN